MTTADDHSPGAEATEPMSWVVSQQVKMSGDVARYPELVQNAVTTLLAQVQSVCEEEGIDPYDDGLFLTVEFQQYGAKAAEA